MLKEIIYLEHFTDDTHFKQEFKIQQVSTQKNRHKYLRKDYFLITLDLKVKLDRKLLLVKSVYLYEALPSLFYPLNDNPLINH